MGPATTQQAVTCDVLLGEQEGRVQASPLLILFSTLKRVVETTNGWTGIEVTSTGTGSQVGHTASSPWLGAGSRKQPDEGR